MKRKRRLISVIFSLLLIFVILMFTVVHSFASVGNVGVQYSDTPLERSFVNFGLTAPYRSSTPVDGYSGGVYYVSDISSNLSNNSILFPDGVPADYTLSNSDNNYIFYRSLPDDVTTFYYRFARNSSTAIGNNWPFSIYLKSLDNISLSQGTNLNPSAFVADSCTVYFLLPPNNLANDTTLNINWLDYLYLNVNIGFRSYTNDNGNIGSHSHNLNLTSSDFDFNGTFNSTDYVDCFTTIANPYVYANSYFGVGHTDLSYFNVDNLYTVVRVEINYGKYLQFVSQKFDINGSSSGIAINDVNISCSLKLRESVEFYDIFTPTSTFGTYYQYTGYFPILMFANRQFISGSFHSESVDLLEHFVHVSRIEVGSSLFDWLGDTIGGVLDVRVFGFASLSDILLVILSIGLFVLVLKYFAGG